MKAAADAPISAHPSSTGVLRVGFALKVFVSAYVYQAPTSTCIMLPL